MTLTQQWWYLNFTRNSFYTLFPEQSIIWVQSKSYLAVSTFVSKELVHSLAEHFQIPVNNLNNLNSYHLKIPKKHCGPHKMPSRATCGPSFWAPDLDLSTSSRKKCKSPSTDLDCELRFTIEWIQRTLFQVYCRILAVQHAQKAFCQTWWFLVLLRSGAPGRE